jgi:hypothetical protein
MELASWPPSQALLQRQSANGLVGLALNQACDLALTRAPPVLAECLLGKSPA